MEQSTKAYEPGTVAVATVRGVKGVRVFRVRADVSAQPWRSVEYVKHTFAHKDEQVTDVRPLVVLDPENASDINDLVQHSDFYMPGQIITPLVKALQRGLRQRVKPPRIPEPGLWGVVKAREENALRDADWVHLPTGAWASLGGSQLATWNALIDPTLIREGVGS